jgi:biotin transport system substrate-specific component
MKTKDLVLIALFAALMCVSVFFSIPTPSMPVTLQTMMVFITGLVLGGKRGAAAMALYMLIGLAGLPVFSNMQGGLGFVLRPSFGFIIGFIAAAYLIGKLSSQSESYIRTTIACICGMLTIYAFGLPYMYFIFNRVLGAEHDITWVVLNGMLIYLPGEAGKIAAAVIIGVPLKKHLRNMG